MVLMVLLNVRVVLTLCNPEMDITRLRGPTKITASFQKERWTGRPAPISPTGKPLGSHIVGSKYLNQPDIPSYDRVDHSRRAHQKFKF